MAKTAALVIGIIFIIIGIWGFFQNPVLGVFDANTTHSIVHLIFGIILVACASKAAATALKWVGIIYIIVAIIGFIQGSSVLGIIDVNAADNWLHLVLGIVIAIFGFAGAKGSASAQM